MLQVARWLAAGRCALSDARRPLDGVSHVLEAEVERRRLALVEADRDVRVLEKLRERQRERHQAAAALEDVKALDEIALRTHAEVQV